MDQLTSQYVHERMHCFVLIHPDSRLHMYATIMCCWQALAECGLAQQKPVQDASLNKLIRNSVYKEGDVTLVCNKLLSARCVREQIEAMQERQLQQTQSTAVATAPQCSKQRTESEDAMHAERCAGSDATAGCIKAEESSQGCVADVVKPAVASPTDHGTSRAAADTSLCLR